jgi:hypothetical protein
VGRLFTKEYWEMLRKVTERKKLQAVEKELEELMLVKWDSIRNWFERIVWNICIFVHLLIR